MEVAYLSFSVFLGAVLARVSILISDGRMYERQSRFSKGKRDRLIGCFAAGATAHTAMSVRRL